MRNCIVAQSGGPTAVINASAVGVVDAVIKTKYYDTVYAGLNGIEGILKGNVKDLLKADYDAVKGLKFTPSSGLGSCRYKMKGFQQYDEEYKNLMQILDELHIETFFYIGGNDSMDTIYQLSEYAKCHNIKTKFIGIPKTIDNDLPETDHTPGFGSAAKLIATITLETYLDSSVYTNNGIFILETMGRDTGWLAASASLARINGKPVADFIYLPEVAFNKENFIEEVREKFLAQNQVYIVVSEGIKDENGKFLSQISSSSHDKFGHAQLGGVCGYVKQLILDAGITTRVKTQELGVIQRCAMHFASKVDIDEAYMVGEAAVKYSIEGKTGYVVGIRRLQSSPYASEAFLMDASKVANHIKYFPAEWINSSKNHINETAFEYLNPLIQGQPDITFENGLPKFVVVTKK